MVTHGTRGEFNHTREDWTSYAERLELYFTASGIVTKKQQQAILLSVCGAERYRLIRDLIAPTKPIKKFFAELVKIVKNHYQPPPSTIGQRFYFNSPIEEMEEVCGWLTQVIRILPICSNTG